MDSSSTILGLLLLAAGGYIYIMSTIIATNTGKVQEINTTTTRGTQQTTATHHIITRSHQVPREAKNLEIDMNIFKGRNATNWYMWFGRR